MMSWGEQFVFRLKVFLVGMAVLCPGFLIWMAPTALTQIDSYSWPTTSGVVLNTLTKTDQSSKDITYFGRVSYRYSVDGQEYTTDLTDLGPGKKHPEPQMALADVKQYKPNDKVTVFYDPEAPQRGVLENGIPPIHQVVLIAMTIGSIVSIIASFFIIRGWLKPQTTSSTPSVDSPPA